MSFNRKLVANALLKLAKAVQAAPVLKYGPRRVDNWTKGTAVLYGKIYQFEIKHFEEPSDYGIDGGRISKLWIAPKPGDFRDTIANYDRGWDVRPMNADAKAVYKAILDKFN